MSCSSGFTAYFPSFTQKGKETISLDFLYHGIGPVDWCENHRFFRSAADQRPPRHAGGVGGHCSVEQVG